MSVIYHLTHQHTWEMARAAGVYAPATLHAEGYIPCSTAQQYVDTANTVFVGQRDLVLLFIDTTQLGAELRHEAASDTASPQVRLYGPLNIDAIFEIAAYEPTTSGNFEEHHETLALTIWGDQGLAAVRTRVLEAMATFDRSWWVAGGWALDLFVGRKTRPHADVEISILSSDQPALWRHLQGWDLRLASPQGSFPRWDGQLLVAPYHQIWARQGKHAADTPAAFSVDPSMLDFLIEHSDGNEWLYRRYTSVTRPIREFGDMRDGVPFVRPEVALLFKAPAPRYKDQRDFEQVLPALDTSARTWLREALDVAHPHHPWRLLL